ncbi:MAG: hypothetical protein R3F17_06320 [Planctomycetota bacterium]
MCKAVLEGVEAANRAFGKQYRVAVIKYCALDSCSYGGYYRLRYQLTE